MQAEWLEINRLGIVGDLVRRVRCLARRVTVFRSVSSAEINLYSAALQGLAPSDQFAVLLDQAPFKPQEHNLIGFGEKFDPADLTPADTLLLRSGIAGEEIEPLLRSVGLAGILTSPVGQLPAGQSHVLRILVALQRPEQVLILNEPFDSVPDEWREPLAQLIANFAWFKHAIVIVTKLSYRPESWIENQAIARVQLERPRKRTIGFGGQSAESEVIAAIREEHQGGLRSGMVAQPMLGVRHVPRAFVPSRRIAWVAVVLLFGLVLSLSALLFAPKVSPKQVASVELTALQSGDARGMASSSANGEVSRIAQDSASSSRDVARKSASILQSYPDDIRNAVFNAFDSPEESIRTWYRTAKLPEGNAIVKAPFRQFDTTTYLESAPETESPSENELEARREEIRRRFLEAIQAEPRGEP